MKQLNNLSEILKEEKIPAEISNLIKTGKPQFPFLRGLDAFGGRSALSSEADIYSASFLNSRSTMIFQYAEYYSPTMRLMSDYIFEETGLSTRTNIYISAPHAFGFGRHNDKNDAVIYQIAGRKNWKLWASESVVESEIEPGAQFFLPKSVDHDVQAVDSLSIHLTISFYDGHRLWKDNDLENTGLKSFGHLDPNDFYLEHPVWGRVADEAVSSNLTFPSLDMEYKILNWRSVKKFTEKGFELYERNNKTECIYAPFR